MTAKTKPKSNVRRSYARPKPVRYHFGGCDIDMVPENPDNQKWKVTTGSGREIGHFATLGASIRGIRADRQA